MSRWMYWFALTSAGLSLAACNHPQVPEAKGETVITLGEAEHLTVVDVESGRIIARPGPISRFSGFSGVSADSQTLYVFDTKPPGAENAEMIGIDTRSLRILWREPWHAVLTAPWTKPTRVLDGTEALLGGIRNGVRGVTAYDSRTRERVGFFGPVTSVTGAHRVPPSSEAPVGLVLVGGARTVDVIPSVGFLFVLDASTLDVRDSVLLVPSSLTRFGGIRQVLPAPDGRHAYVQTDNRIVRYDLVERRITASVPLPSFGKMAISPDGGTLYHTDSGDGRDFPGSGFLYVFDANLSRRDRIDLRGPQGNPATIVPTHDAVVSRDGRHVYVAAGSASLGPLYTPRPGRVMVVDAVAGKLIREVPTGDWFTQYIFLR